MAKDEEDDGTTEAANVESRAKERSEESDEDGSFLSSAIVIGVALAAAIGFLSLTR